MTHQVRKSVFETNSSSSHSLTLSSTDLVDLPLSPLTLRRGTLTLAMDEYGWEWHRYYTPEEKANYLFTSARGSSESVPHGPPEEVTKELREENPRIDMLCRVIEEHTGVKVLVEPGSSGYIDHQSTGTGLELFNSEEELKKFLFSEDAFVQTGNDNSEPGRYIETDKGISEEVYARWYRTPAKDAVTVTFKQSEHDWRVQLMTASGHDLQEKSPELFKRVQNEGCVTAIRKTSTGKSNAFRYADNPVGSAMSALSEIGLGFISGLSVSNTHRENPDAEQYYEVLTEFELAVPADLAQALSELT